MIIAIIGGTGKEGKGLAYRWAKIGHQVIIGSREQEKAQRIASELNETYPNIKPLHGKQNLTAAQNADVVVITVPYSAHPAIVESIKSSVQGKIVIDVTVPLVPPKVSQVHIPASGSAAQEAQEMLGENVKVVSAFQNVSYEKLLEEADTLSDVLVCGNDSQAKQIVIDLISEAGMRGFDAGPIQNSIVSEGLTSVLININKKFGVHSAGIRIIGID
ncbi:MAG TPA: NADPH-dependent F420 reductase [Anaerolineaceae bacterium]|uniref:F420-dependent NADPH reductase n=1 Tax=Anaerolinea thermophila TaxID=167964 RepID=A0A124FN24_9CHLR|nr:MAG: F420-dependent NADPH reductase [Anaerolinea thermophila]HAF61244.1 NADPH-dependent F420 reductase [Anaerolineaceae bacterium]